MKQEYFVYQVSYLKPLLKGLINSGINIDKLIKKSDLRYFNISNPQNYIPSEVLYDFLLLARNNYRIGNFITLFNDYFKLHKFGNYGAFITQLPSLRSALHYFILYESIPQTNSQNHLKIYDNHAELSFHFIDKYSAGRKISENMNLAIIFHLFSLFGTNNWKPIEFHTPYNLISDIEPILPRGEYTILFNQPSYKLVFSKSMLNNVVNTSFNGNDIKVPEYPDTSFIAVMEKVLNSYKSGYIPTLKILADNFNTSESSLKRCLKSSETKFSNILGHTLFKKAVKLLARSDMNITLISERLGYSDSPNFIRSFKKWSGTTPAMYRTKLRHEL